MTKTLTSSDCPEESEGDNPAEVTITRYYNSCTKKEKFLPAENIEYFTEIVYTDLVLQETPFEYEVE